MANAPSAAGLCVDMTYQAKGCLSTKTGKHATLGLTLSFNVIHKQSYENLPAPKLQIFRPFQRTSSTNQHAQFEVQTSM